MYVSVKIEVSFLLPFAWLFHRCLWHELQCLHLVTPLPNIPKQKIIHSLVRAKELLKLKVANIRLVLLLQPDYLFPHFQVRRRSHFEAVIHIKTSLVLGPTTASQRPSSLIYSPDSSDRTIFKGTSAGILSSPSVNTQSYPPKARSNFVLGPTKSVIFANNNDSNMQVWICSKLSIYLLLYNNHHKMSFKYAAQKAKYQSSVCSNPSTFYSTLPLIKPPENPYAPNFQPFTTFADTTKVISSLEHLLVLTPRPFY